MLSKTKIRESVIALVHINGYVLSGQLRQLADVLEGCQDGVRLRYTDGQILPEDFIPKLWEDGFFNNRHPARVTVESLEEIRELALVKYVPPSGFKRRPKRRNADRDAEMLMLKSRGWPMGDIAELFKVSRGVVYAAVKAAEADIERDGNS